jgi:hypothetical protein
MLQSVERWTRREHPARKYLMHRLIRPMVDHLQEGSRFRRLAEWRRITIVRRDRQRCETDRNADRREYVRGPPGDLVQSAQNHGAFVSIFAWNSIGQGELALRHVEI